VHHQARLLNNGDGECDPERPEALVGYIPAGQAAPEVVGPEQKELL
jgi:hypothetical protein